MRLGQYFILLIVLAMIPAAACGSYFAYTQARARVEELNQITPLNETDFGKVVRLAVGLEEAEGESATPTPIFAIEVSPTPTEPLQDHTPPPTVESGVAAAPIPSAEQTAVAEAAASPSSPISDPRRVNVLLLGIDQRQGEEGQFRTDTMIVFSLDPVGKTGAMLSIPRDLWVSIPGQAQQERINTANFIGDNPNLNYPGGGPALAMLTVEKVLGIPIHHYVLINFDAFTTFIDIVGEIEICPKELIDDPKYPDGSYGTIHITIQPGCQPMDATVLLQYARTRATPGGDFDRAARQQEVILAVRNKILSTGGIADLLSNALTIWQSVSANVKTDLTLDQVIELALVASEINDIRTGTISEKEVLQSLAPDGSQILIPIQTDIFALVADLFRPPNRPAAAPDSISITLDPDNVPLAVREEAAIIALLNGTTIQGRARNLEAYVESYSLDVGYIGNANTTDVIETSITYFGDHADSAEYLAAVLATINGNNLPRIERGEGTNPQGDVVVVIGTDLAVPPAQ